MSVTGVLYMTDWLSLYKYDWCNGLHDTDVRASHDGYTGVTDLGIKWVKVNPK